MGFYKIQLHCVFERNIFLGPCTSRICVICSAVILSVTKSEQNNARAHDANLILQFSFTKTLAYMKTRFISYQYYILYDVVYKSPFCVFLLLKIYSQHPSVNQISNCLNLFYFYAKIFQRCHIGLALDKSSILFSTSSQ